MGLFVFSYVLSIFVGLRSSTLGALLISVMLNLCGVALSKLLPGLMKPSLTADHAQWPPTHAAVVHLHATVH